MSIVVRQKRKKMYRFQESDIMVGYKFCKTPETKLVEKKMGSKKKDSKGNSIEKEYKEVVSCSIPIEKTVLSVQGNTVFYFDGHQKAGGEHKKMYQFRSICRTTKESFLKSTSKFGVSRIVDPDIKKKLEFFQCYLSECEYLKRSGPTYGGVFRAGFYWEGRKGDKSIKRLITGVKYFEPQRCFVVSVYSYDTGKFNWHIEERLFNYFYGRSMKEFKENWTNLNKIYKKGRLIIAKKLTEEEQIGCEDLNLALGKPEIPNLKRNWDEMNFELTKVLYKSRKKNAEFKNTLTLADEFLENEAQEEIRKIFEKEKDDLLCQFLTAIEDGDDVSCLIKEMESRGINYKSMIKDENEDVIIHASFDDEFEFTENGALFEKEFSNISLDD